jgi:succinate dehydrogenase/fumarate reductase flavoprotein subunit
MNTLEYDVVVAGGGNAALFSDPSAAENGARVAVLVSAQEESRGSNSAFTAVTMRTVYAGLDDIKKLVPDLSEAEIAETDFLSYSTDQLYDDMARATPYRTNPDLCEVRVTQRNAALHWLREMGVRYMRPYGAQSFKVDGKRKFWGGVTVGAVGAGEGLIDFLYAALKKHVPFNPNVLDMWHRRARDTEVQLGEHHRGWPFGSLWCDLRYHVYLWRHQDQPAGRGTRYGGPRHPRLVGCW